MCGKRLNILVTGANGQLGRCIRDASEGSAHRYIFSDVNDVPGLETLSLDITDQAAARLVTKSESVDIIINCAGFTNVDKAETETVFADLLNREAVANLAVCAKSRDALLIHISTDYIFSGNDCKPIAEDATPAPLGVYGATKLAGEKAILDSGCRHIIIRTAWLYSKYGRNFVKTIIGLSEQRPEITVVSDQIGTPTRAEDLAAFIVGLIEKGQDTEEGIYNYTGEGIASWYDFAHEICVVRGSACMVLPCSSEDYPTAARRPHYSVLNKSLVKKTFGIKLPHWTDALKTCLETL